MVGCCLRRSKKKRRFPTNTRKQSLLAHPRVVVLRDEWVHTACPPDPHTPKPAMQTSPHRRSLVARRLAGQLTSKVLAASRQTVVRMANAGRDVATRVIFEAIARAVEVSTRAAAARMRAHLQRWTCEGVGMSGYCSIVRKKLHIPPFYAHLTKDPLAEIVPSVLCAKSVHCEDDEICAIVQALRPDLKRSTMMTTTRKPPPRYDLPLFAVIQKVVVGATTRYIAHVIHGKLHNDEIVFTDADNEYDECLQVSAIFVSGKRQLGVSAPKTAEIFFKTPPTHPFGVIYASTNSYPPFRVGLNPRAINHRVWCLSAELNCYAVTPCDGLVVVRLDGSSLLRFDRPVTLVAKLPIPLVKKTPSGRLVVVAPAFLK